ncbi:hypothetical protein MTP99_004910 [Tenebrio molitor]|nr:hypothetical protein MTP99_004910 [Tenebrio molitor]
MEELDRAALSLVFEFIDSITDDQAFDSDLDGDSDADDNIPELSSSSAGTSRGTKRSLTHINEELDFDSDDSIADPDFHPNINPKPTTVYAFSSDNDEPLANAVPKTTLKKTQQRYQDEKFSWTKYPYLPHVFPASTFEEDSGSKVSTSQSPVEIFSGIMSDDFFNVIVTESNHYAQQKNNSLELTLEELKAFLGILIIMGLNSLPSLRL